MIVACLIVLGMTQGPLSDSELAALRRIGVEVSIVADTGSAAHSHEFATGFEIPGFFRAAGRVQHAPPVDFAPIDEANEPASVIGACRKCGASTTTRKPDASFESWCLREMASPIRFSAPVLQIEQVDESRTGVGSIRVRSIRDKPVRIEAVPLGCGIACETRLPLLVPPDGVDLRFRMEPMRKRVGEANVALLLKLDDGRSVPLPFSVSIPRPTLRVEPPQLSFPAVSAGDIALSLEVDRARIAHVDLVRVPSCLEIYDSAMSSSGARFIVRELPKARRRHDCDAVLMSVRFDNETGPETVAVPVAHNVGIEDLEGRAVRVLPVMPGERLEAYRSASGELVITCPTRVALAPSILRALGFELHDTFDVARSGTSCDWWIENSGLAGSPDVRVLCLLRSGLRDCTAEWRASDR